MWRRHRLAVHPLIYQVHSRAWLRELAAEKGDPSAAFTLDDVPNAALEVWAVQGFTHVWLMGVWCIGPAARHHAVREAAEDGVPTHEVCGSPFAICGYEVDSELGGVEALARFRRRLRGVGLRLILDFIPNHVALDHPWIEQYPERFIRSSRRRRGYFKPKPRSSNPWIAHGRDPFFSPWVDTAQLDWTHPAVHEAMLDELVRVAALCDGVRVDMAMLILPDVFRRTWEANGEKANLAVESFWVRAIRHVKTPWPDFLFIAEVYWDLEQRLLSEGFDYAYEKRSYDLLLTRQASSLMSHWRGLDASLWRRGLRFLENHDEARVASLCTSAEHRAWLCLLLSQPGACLIHHGQMQGLKERAPIARRGVPPGKPLELDSDEATHYQSALATFADLRARGDHCAPLQISAAWECNESHGHFVALGWIQAGFSSVVLVVNLSGDPAQCRVRLPSFDPWCETAEVRDRLSELAYACPSVLIAEQGLYIALPGYGSHLLEILLHPRSSQACEERRGLPRAIQGIAEGDPEATRPDQRGITRTLPSG